MRARPFAVCVSVCVRVALGSPPRNLYESPFWRATLFSFSPCCVSLPEGGGAFWVNLGFTLRTFPGETGGGAVKNW